MKIDRPKYKDYTVKTTMNGISKDYPIIGKIREQGKFSTAGLNKILGREMLTGQEEVNPEFWGDLLEALEGVEL
jgi:hypothetical protein